MAPSNDLSANFSVAEAAKTEIEQLRKVWNRDTADPADVVMMGWGTTVLNSGRQSSGVVVSFYGQQERSSVEHGIKRVSGIEIVFFITEPDIDRFHGRTLDFCLDRGFFLRP